MAVSTFFSAVLCRFVDGDSNFLPHDHGATIELHILHPMYVKSVPHRCRTSGCQATLKHGLIRWALLRAIGWLCSEKTCPWSSIQQQISAAYLEYIQLLTHFYEPVRARAHNSEGTTHHREHESSQNNLTDNRV